MDLAEYPKRKSVCDAEHRIYLKDECICLSFLDYVSDVIGSRRAGSCDDAV
jgi:hypothetical protein